MPWLGIDEVLRIAGWSRSDVDAIATDARILFRRYHLRVPLWRELRYAFERARGTRARLSRLSRSCATGSAPPIRMSCFTPTASCGKIRSGRTRRCYFANHHEAHALAALFYTDWNSALIYTSDGIGDNVSYSMRTLKDGALDCHYGDDRYLTQPAESFVARDRLRRRDTRLRLSHVAARGQAHRPRGLWSTEAERGVRCACSASPMTG